MTVPAPVYVLAVAHAALVGDWALGRWAARQAVAARAVSLWDDGVPVELSEAPTPVASVHELRVRSDADERAIGRLVGAQRCSP